MVSSIRDLTLVQPALDHLAAGVSEKDVLSIDIRKESRDVTVVEVRYVYRPANRPGAVT